MKDSQRRAMFARMEQYELTTSRNQLDMPDPVYAKNKQDAINKIRPKLRKGEMILKIERVYWPKKKNKDFDPVTASSEERIEETERINKIEKEMK